MLLVITNHTLGIVFSTKGVQKIDRPFDTFDHAFDGNPQGNAEQSKNRHSKTDFEISAVNRSFIDHAIIDEDRIFEHSAHEPHEDPADGIERNGYML
jgi:hypothetical protein